MTRYLPRHISSGTRGQCSFENTSLPLTKGAANVWHYLADPGLVAKCRKNLYLCISAFSLRLPHVLLHVAKKLLLRTQDATWTTYSVPPQALTGCKCMQNLWLKRSSERHHLKMTAGVAAKSHCASRWTILFGRKLMAYDFVQRISMYDIRW